MSVIQAKYFKGPIRELKTQHAIGEYLKDHCPSASFSDYPGKKAGSSTFSRFVGTVRNHVLKHIDRVPNEKLQMVLRPWSKVSPAIQNEVTAITRVDFPDVDLFDQQWIIKPLACLIINVQNRNEKVNHRVRHATIQEAVAHGVISGMLLALCI